MWFIILLIPLLLTLLIVYVSVRKFDYWTKKNVPHLKPTPFLGNYGDFILLKTFIGNVTKKICEQFPDEPYIGAYYGTEPTLLVQDPEILKLVFTKDFYYFSGREASEYSDREAVTKSIFFVHGDRWKITRQMLTPLYTTAKMKKMFPLIEKCIHVFETLLIDETSVSNVIEVNALFSSFALDCVGSCAFGIEMNVMQKNLVNNPFRKLADSIFDNSNYRGFLNIARAVWPRIFYALGFQAFPPEVKDGLMKLITGVMHSRKYTPASRNDFVDLMLTIIQNGNSITGDSMTNPRTGEFKKLHLSIDDEVVVGQCASFFGGAFETSATTMTLTLFELVKHEEVQSKVFKEIQEYLVKHDHKLNYDCINELPYLTACIDETQRLHPLFTVITREVTEDYTFPTGLKLEKGLRVHIPVYHMHRNPKNFPEPQKFRPERHLGEEKSKIKPYTYLPFGEGPRTCIGMRFSRMQVISGLVTVLKDYKVELADGMSPKVDYDPRMIVTHTTDDVNLNFLMRNKLKSS